MTGMVAPPPMRGGESAVVGPRTITDITAMMTATATPLIAPSHHRGRAPFSEVFEVDSLVLMQQQWFTLVLRGICRSATVCGRLAGVRVNAPR
ncbi:hypothetical protein GCM10009619_13800 [Williamsia maris]